MSKSKKKGLSKADLADYLADMVRYKISGTHLVAEILAQALEKGIIDASLGITQLIAWEESGVSDGDFETDDYLISDALDGEVEPERDGMSIDFMKLIEAQAQENKLERKTRKLHQCEDDLRLLEKGKMAIFDRKGRHEIAVSPAMIQPMKASLEYLIAYYRSLPGRARVPM